MVLNGSADWSQGRLPVGAGLIDHFWTPDLIIHDLVSAKEEKNERRKDEPI